jgi:hypothetical protein
MKTRPFSSWAFGLAVLAALGVSPRVRAWSSTAAPLFDAIHQDAITQVLTALGVPPTMQRVTTDQQKVVDGDQATDDSFMHSMAGGLPGVPPPPDVPHWIRESDGFILKELEAARRSGTSTTDGYQHLGSALHALTDATSPAHRGFQLWSADEGIFQKLGHVMKERSYPDEGTAERSELEGAVRWGYALFAHAEQPLPTTFFKADGGLDLPAQYRDGGI